jgi:hypothetical protein
MQFNCAYTELVSTSKLVPNPKNANKHSQEQIERLAKIIDFQGQRSPVVVSKRSGFITKGHGRLMAMQELGWDQVAVDYQDYLSEAQEYADIIADNEIARWAELDLGMVNMEMAEFDLDLELLGMKDFSIDSGIVDLPEMDGTDPDCQQVTFLLSNEQKDILDDAMSKAKKELDCTDGINTNSNGNTLSAIVRTYV